MTTTDGVATRLRGIFVDALTIEAPADDVDLIEAGVIDSLALVQLLFEIERQFGVELPLDELEIDNFRTVEAMTEFVTSRLAS
jgi:D-alanine--poly(phosphoribitol) ligase subunit 2